MNKKPFSLIKWALPLMAVVLMLLCCTQCSVRDLVYLPPVPKDEALYLQQRARWEQYRRTFSRPDAKLSGWFLEKKGAPLLVYYGGNAMDISSMLPLLEDSPHAKLLVNYRGYGLSTGSPTQNDIVADSVAILDEILKETGRTTQDVILVGQSLGSGVACQVAAVRQVKKLTLIVPFDSLLATAQDIVPWLPVEWLLDDHYRSDLAAKNITCPVSILAAGDDEVIHPSHARKLKDCFPTPAQYTEFPGAHHNSIFYAPGFDKAFADSVRP